MNKQDFSSAKVGDKLWSIHLGECIVIEILFDEHIRCQNTNKDHSYYLDGKYLHDDIHPSLFWSNPQIQIPEKPKRKVKKEEKIWINIYEDNRLSYHKTKESANVQTECWIVKQQIEGTLTYEVEE